MAGRAARGEAKPFKLNTGRWQLWLELPAGSSGERRRKAVRARTRALVVREANRARADLDLGVEPADRRVTVSALVATWLESREGKVSTTTLDLHRSIARTHIDGSVVGRKAVAALTVRDVNALLRSKRDAGLSPRTCKAIRDVLRASIDWAVQQGIAQRNVVKFTEPPKQRPSEHRAMTMDEAKAFKAAAAGTPFEAAFAVMMTLGLRPGECLALAWSDIDLDARTLRVRHSLKRDGSMSDAKNDGSRRQLTLTAGLVPLLRARKAAQSADRLRCGESWTDSGLIFTTTIGTAVSDRNLTLRVFRPICERAGAGRWDLHELRHTAATLMLANGVPIERVSKVLGHSSIRVTADVYGHLVPRDLETAADVMDALWS